jgi:hypothetical protein
MKTYKTLDCNCSIVAIYYLLFILFIIHKYNWNVKWPTYDNGKFMIIYLFVVGL